MPELAERIRTEPRPRKAPAAPSRARVWLSALKPTSKRSVAGAALGAMMIGIVVNALALQHGRRIAPSADDAPPATSAARSAPAPAAQPEPTRPAPSATVVAVAKPAKPADPIADFLRNQGADKRRLTLAAQAALAKLGFGVKATGALDANTRDALAEFEKSRRLPVSTEITGKLVKTLNAAAAAE